MSLSVADLAWPRQQPCLPISRIRERSRGAHVTILGPRLAVGLCVTLVKLRPCRTQHQERTPYTVLVPSDAYAWLRPAERHQPVSRMSDKDRPTHRLPAFSHRRIEQRRFQILAATSQYRPDHVLVVVVSIPLAMWRA